MLRSTALKEYFDLLTEQQLADPDELRYHLDWLFRGVTLSGKRVLDVGAGNGLLSFYAACCGASKVISLEPEAAGSTTGVTGDFRRILERLAVSEVVVPRPARLQDWDPGSDRFDVLLLNNSINHLDEEACENLRRDSRARETYRLILEKLFDVASEGATLIITDCSRYNFFVLLHVRNPFAPSIAWRKHQSPNCWAELLLEVGFWNPKIRWTSYGAAFFRLLGHRPRCLRLLARWLLGNRIAAYFLYSHFCLTMEKPSQRESA